MGLWKTCRVPENTEKMTLENLVDKSVFLTALSTLSTLDGKIQNLSTKFPEQFHIGMWKKDLGALSQTLRGTLSPRPRQGE